MPRALAPSPATERILRVYAFDPSRGTRFENHLTVRIPYEPLKRGPIGRKVAVIDYDASNRCYYEGIDLEERAILGQNGLAPSEANPQFHQQMVYAVAMDTIRRFEVALGREVRWKADTGPKSDPYHGLLRIFPHAMQEANAFYDRSQRALLFGYFEAARGDVGSNLPGQIVFTCLSHDIVVHETTHAVLDGIRDLYIEPTSVDAPAFHEGFADIVALLQHFSLKESLLDTIQRTGGLIHRKQLAPTVRPEEGGARIAPEIGEDNPMVDLARQFGEAMGNRKALRDALGTRPEPQDLATKLEPHDRGAILVAAVFDAFFTVYINKTRDLLRMAYPDGREIVPNFLHHDLANRLAAEASKTASRIQNICLRALDYCPPVDITFGDYLRALVTSDRDAISDDRVGYRAALISAFRARGIRPEGVLSYSEEALCWDRYEGMKATDFNPDFRRLWQLLAEYEDRPDPMKRGRLFKKLWAKAETFGSGLGLAPTNLAPIVAKSIHPLHRVLPDGSLQRQIVAELVQTRDERLDPDDKSAPTFKFRGGTTLLINRKGEVRYSISKPIHGPEGARRLERQREYLREMSAGFPSGPFDAFSPERDFKLRGIHRGY